MVFTFMDLMAWDLAKGRNVNKEREEGEMGMEGSKQSPNDGQV